MYTVEEKDFLFDLNIVIIKKENKTVWTLRFIEQLQNQKLKQIWVMLNLVDILNTHRYTENEFACVDFEFRKIQTKALKLKV